MNPTARYYAFSTIAQCAAALAALIGFPGIWRLDRLRDEGRWAEDEVIAAVLRTCNRGVDNIPFYGRAFFLQKARELVAEPRPAMEDGWDIAYQPQGKQIVKSTLTPILRRYAALRRRQWGLLWVLNVFLLVTLSIAGLAFVGFWYINELTTYAWTPWLPWIAGGWLAVGPMIVVLVAARLPHDIEEMLRPAFHEFIERRQYLPVEE